MSQMLPSSEDHFKTCQNEVARLGPHLSRADDGFLLLHVAVRSCTMRVLSWKKTPRKKTRTLSLDYERRAKCAVERHFHWGLFKLSVIQTRALGWVQHTKPADRCLSLYPFSNLLIPSVWYGCEIPFSLVLQYLWLRAEFSYRKA